VSPLTDGKLNLRSLAFFRIGLGLLVWSFVIQLAPDYEVFYRQLAPHTVPDFVLELAFWSLPLFATLLLIGFRTRLSTFLCWLGIIVLQQANPQILQGGDVLLKLLLFWSLFLPLGATWSVDAWRRKEPAKPWPLTTQLASWALAGQIVLVYWSAALLKSDPLWTQNGNALFYALNIEHFTTPFGLYLRQFPDLLRVLTFGTRIFEFIGPLLLFVPVYRYHFRLVAVTLFIGFHLIGMQSLLRIGLFPWVCATAWLIFLPASFWNFFDKKREDQKSKSSQRKQPKRVSSSELKPVGLLDRITSGFILISFLDVCAWNTASLNGPDAFRWMKQHDAWSHIFQLDQRWNMYAPYPRDEHGWLVVPADLANGTQVDLFTSQPVSWDKPGDLGAYFGDDRWRRYLSNLFNDRDPQALQGYADYLVRNWNQHHGEDQKVQIVTIIFMKQITMPDLTNTPPEKDVLYLHAY